MRGRCHIAINQLKDRISSGTLTMKDLDRISSSTGRTARELHLTKYSRKPSPQYDLPTRLWIQPPIIFGLFPHSIATQRCVILCATRVLSTGLCLSVGQDHSRQISFNKKILDLSSDKCAALQLVFFVLVPQQSSTEFHHHCFIVKSLSFGGRGF